MRLNKQTNLVMLFIFLRIKKQILFFLITKIQIRHSVQSHGWNKDSIFQPPLGQSDVGYNKALGPHPDADV